MKENNMFEEKSREQLTWMNRPEYWKYTEDGGLLVEAPTAADFYQDPAGIHNVNSAPFLYFHLGGSFELTTRLSVDMKHIYDSGCLMLMADQKNWAKLCFEYNGKYPAIVSVVTRDGSSDDCNSERVTLDETYLRISKAENCISFYFSEDAEEWKLVRYFGMKFPTSLMVGVVAQSPKGVGCAVNFDYLQLLKNN